MKTGQGTWTDTCPKTTHEWPTGLGKTISFTASEGKQIKTTARCHRTPARAAAVNKAATASVGAVVGERNPHSLLVGL